MTDLNVSLLPWQQKVWNDPVRFQVIAAGRRTGKSRLAAWKLIIEGLAATKGSVFYVAPTQGQARDIMWDMLLELGNPVIASSHVNNLQIKLVNGATIALKGADRPETMRGVSLKFLVMDEYADMKPEVWEQILRPALADQKGSAMFIGTPMGRNHFYELYTYACVAEDETFAGYHFTSYDNLNDQMKKNQRFFRIEELTHGNKKKTDRIVWALQGRFEHGTITLNKGSWNSQFLDELFQFPNQLVHDDLIDSLAYVDQLAKIAYAFDYEEDDYQFLDKYSGY